MLPSSLAKKRPERIKFAARCPRFNTPIGPAEKARENTKKSVIYTRIKSCIYACKKSPKRKMTTTKLNSVGCCLVLLCI